MEKAVRKSAYWFMMASMLIVTSCLKNEDPPNPRTREIELEEIESVLSYLESEGHDVDTSDLGIYYIVHEQGEGPTAQFGDTLRLEYIGYFFSGQVFDASAFHYEDSIWQFVFKEGELIPGFEEGISLMNKGSEFEMIIPSEHAYGPDGTLFIEPFTTLIFSTIMRDINPESE